MDIETLGHESLGHFTVVDRIVASLGGELEWQADMLPRLVGVEDMLGIQLEKEKQAYDMYSQARQIALNNKKRIKVGGFFDSLLGRGISNVVQLDHLVNELSRLMSEEERHARMVEDIVATHKSLISKKKQ